MKEEKTKVGFFLSLPVCIIMTYFVLPVGLILIFLRLYKKGKIKKKTKDIAIGVIIAISAFIVLILCLPSSPDSEKPTDSNYVATSENTANKENGEGDSSVPDESSVPELTVGTEVTESNVPSETAAIAQPSMPEDAHQAIKDVLLGTELFINQENDQTEYIDGMTFLCGESFSSPLIPMSFTAVDLDKDGVWEAIVELTDNWNVWSIVLHYYDGNVYGYGYGFRSMQDVYSDGVILASSGAADSVYYRLAFDGTEISEIIVSVDNLEGRVPWYDYSAANVGDIWQGDMSHMTLENVKVQDYERACQLAYNGNYDDALPIFESLGDYLDAASHVDGIQCIRYADQVSARITAKYLSMSFVGIDVYCEYSPASYTFTAVIEIPDSGLFGMLSSMGAAAGEDISYNEEGANSLAEDMYFDYFYAEGYYGIICRMEIRDLANGQYVSGEFSGTEMLNNTQG